MAIGVSSNHARRGIELSNLAQPDLSRLLAPRPTASNINAPIGLRSLNNSGELIPLEDSIRCRAWR